MKNQIIEAFRSYKELGLDPLPIPNQNGLPTKGPKIAGWQQTAANNGYTEADFESPCNLGVLLGGQNHLTDIDCDSQWAVKAAGFVFHGCDPFMIFGRSGKPNSHYVFYTDESLVSFKVNHPVSKECIVEYRCVKLDGTRGLQTVFPPSIWCNKADTSDQQQITTSQQTPDATPVNARDSNHFVTR